MARQLDQKDTIAWRRCRGMNSWDSPDDLPDDLCVEAVNVQFEQGGLGVKRRGSEQQALIGMTFEAYAYLASFVPAGGAPVAELFIAAYRSPLIQFAIVRNGATADQLSMADTTTTPICHTAQLNNKLFIAYHADNHANVLHVMDAGTLSARRTGVDVPGAPVPTNSGAPGTYPANLRYYRVQWRVYDPATGTILRSSALGPSAAFTPSGTAAGVDVAHPFVPISGLVTHWATYVSADDATYYFLQLVPIATPAIFDNATYNTWTGELAPSEGTYTNWPSVKFLCSTGDRLLGFGAWEAGHPVTVTGSMVPLAGRVYFSAVINTTDADDEEYVSNTIQQKGWIDIARNAGAEDRGIAQAIDNQIMVAQAEGLYLLIPTGQASSPYRRVSLSPTLGWVSQWSTFAGEDESGRPALYFLDPKRGPYRYGSTGLTWLGYDIQKIWEQFAHDAPPELCHGVYLSETRECRWWIPMNVGPSAPPTTANLVLNFNVQLGQPGPNGDIRGGWSKFEARSTPGFTSLYETARTSVMWSETFATPRSGQLKPYTGFSAAGLPSAGPPILLRTDAFAGCVDALGTTFQQPYVAYFLSKAWLVPPNQHIKQIIRAWLKAEAQNGVEILLGLIQNYNTQQRYSSVRLDPAPPTTPPPPYLGFQQGRVQKRFDSASLMDAFAFQVMLGDPGMIDRGTTAPSTAPWTLDQWFATIVYGAET
jgi:hypothetical protein